MVIPFPRTKNTPLRLFQIWDNLHNLPAEPDVYYSDMLKARTQRRALITEDPDNDELRYVVTLGPDHRRYKNAQTR